MKRIITIHCDGSAIGNPGKGGWGVVVEDGEHIRELGGAHAHTTNNRMELTAAIEALTSLKAGAHVTVKTDSRYVIQGITSWVHGWVRNNWQTSQKTEVLNKDLWQALKDVTERHTVTWEHVRAHIGVLLNERVDVIANGFAHGEHVQLFQGTVSQYKDFLKGMPKARTVSKSKNTGPAYSYVSLVDGVLETHKTWTECEERVKGKSARYKKVFSADEEAALIREWSA